MTESLRAATYYQSGIQFEYDWVNKQTNSNELRFLNAFQSKPAQSLERRKSGQIREKFKYVCKEFGGYAHTI